VPTPLITKNIHEENIINTVALWVHYYTPDTKKCILVYNNMPYLIRDINKREYYSFFITFISDGWRWFNFYYYYIIILYRSTKIKLIIIFFFLIIIYTIGTIRVWTNWQKSIFLIENLNEEEPQPTDDTFVF